MLSGNNAAVSYTAAVQPAGLVNSSSVPVARRSLILPSTAVTSLYFPSFSRCRVLIDAVGSGTMPVRKRTGNSRRPPTRRPVDPSIVVVNELRDCGGPRSTLSQAAAHISDFRSTTACFSNRISAALVWRVKASGFMQQKWIE